MGDETTSLFVAARNDGRVDGLILESSALSSHPSQIVGPQLAFAALAAFLAPYAPTIPIADSFLEAATRNSDFVTLRRTDPLAQNWISPRYLMRYGIDAPCWPGVARRVRAPMLALVASRDDIVAQRIEDRTAGGEILASDETYRRVAHLVDAEALPEVSVKGRAAPVRIWRIRGFRPPPAAFK